MPSYPQIDNPKGAFGYPGGGLTTASQADGQGGYAPKTRTVRNASTVQVVPIGASVVWSTLSSLTDEVAITTVIGSPLFAGVALTSAGLHTGRTTVTTAAGLGGIGTDYFTISQDDVFHGALLTSGTVAGDLVQTVASTVGGSTGGGYLGPVAATAAGNYGVAGIAFTSGTTGTTGFLTTSGPRGIVLIRPSIVGSISTA